MKAIDVAAAVIFRDKKLLITQRYADSHLGGLWEFPGGKREPGETFESCLARELLEELGIVVDVGPLLHSLTHTYPEKTVHLRFFHCKWKANEMRAIGCAAFQWISEGELDAYPFPAADATLLGLLRQRPDLWTAGER